MEQNSFIASAWSNGRTNNETGAGYGLRIKINDRDRVFNENQRHKPVTLKLVGNRKSYEVTVSINNDCFWNNCPEFRDQEIGLWFIENEFINKKPASPPWPYRKPPKFQIVSIGKCRFEVNPVPRTKGLSQSG